MSDPTIIARSVEKTNLWLDELANELGTHDRKAHVTRRTEQSGRRRLPLRSTYLDRTRNPSGCQACGLRVGFRS